MCMKQLFRNMLFSIALTESDWEQHASCYVECDDLCANGRINTCRRRADQVRVPAVTSVWRVPVLQLSLYIFFSILDWSLKLSKKKEENVKIKCIFDKKGVQEILLSYPSNLWIWRKKFVVCIFRCLWFIHGSMRSKLLFAWQ